MERIHEFNRALNKFDGSFLHKRATQLLQYTAMRTIELRTLRWDNVDFDNRLIQIDPAVMKGRRLHVVPMSSQTITLLNSLKPLTGQYELVFPGKSKKHNPVSGNIILGVITKTGFKGLTCGHGFRHQFSTVMNEYKWHHDAIEVQLAHVIRETRGIYNHAKYLSTRREIMQWWADWLDEKHDEDELRQRLTS
ncbi:tyrosine-type recombinase/integrase [Erwinia sp. BNK-24-b]|uniref:tyrosine-type recombinase/integrase n=1 Tax=unclassified Erwinia TaxID=2622719 RepID=UPI0039BF9478